MVRRKDLGTYQLLAASTPESVLTLQEIFSVTRDENYDIIWKQCYFTTAYVKILKY